MAQMQVRQHLVSWNALDEWQGLSVILLCEEQWSAVAGARWPHVGPAVLPGLSPVPQGLWMQDNTHLRRQRRRELETRPLWHGPSPSGAGDASGQ